MTEPQQVLPAAPPVDAAAAHLDQLVDAALARDFEQLCSLASGTCDVELQGSDGDHVPRSRPIVVEVTVHQPVGNSSGGVLFVLCGVDGRGEPYESEVLVFDAGQELLATAAVFWAGTRVIMGPAGGEGVDVGGAIEDEGRCP